MTKIRLKKLNQVGYVIPEHIYRRGQSQFALESAILSPAGDGILLPEMIDYLGREIEVNDLGVDYPNHYCIWHNGYDYKIGWWLVEEPT